MIAECVSGDNMLLDSEMLRWVSPVLVTHSWLRSWRWRRSQRWNLLRPPLRLVLLIIIFVRNMLIEDHISFSCGCSWPTPKLLIICRWSVLDWRVQCDRWVLAEEYFGGSRLTPPNFSIYLVRIAQLHLVAVSCQRNLLHTPTGSVNQLIRCACRSWWKSSQRYSKSRVFKDNPAMLMWSKLSL